MEVNGYLRVVTLRRGKMKAGEFRLRQGEKGLSLFAWTDSPTPAVILDAVQNLGKKGELGAALLELGDLRSLGLVVVRTPGDTDSPDVNAVHFEARLAWWRRIILRLKGIPVDEYFNAQLS